MQENKSQTNPTDRYIQTRPKAIQQKVLRIDKRIYKRTLPAALDVSVLLGRTMHLEARTRRINLLSDVRVESGFRVLTIE